jgi:ADP-ribosylglycohydrolase
MTSSPHAQPLSTADRVRGALWGMMVGDALAMPVHWYYRLTDLQRDFGVIRDYQAPKAIHPSSIMSLSSTSRAGRGTQSGSVVGDVILKGKKHHWGPAHRHYHQGMQAGENTLNALCARLLMRGMVRHKAYAPADFLADYVDFMTTEGSHNDTYASPTTATFLPTGPAACRRTSVPVPQAMTPRPLAAWSVWPLWCCPSPPKATRQQPLKRAWPTCA